MRRVLIISYYFPPDGGAGTQRTAKFCKYLPAFGWQPFVLTRTSERRRTEWEPEDETLLNDITGTDVIRVPQSVASSSWARALPRIDGANAWLEPAFEQANAIVRQRHIDAVLITMSPFDLSFIGQRLQRTAAIPVVYDLRDPWALDGWRIYSYKRRWKTDFRVMCETLQSADGVIGNTQGATIAISAAIPDLDPKRICTIPNGFDRADFQSTMAAPSGIPSQDGNFYLVHTGTFHSSWLYKYNGVMGWLKKFRHFRSEPIRPDGRTPFHLLRAVRILRDEGHPLAHRLRIIFVGQSDEATKRCIDESGIAHMVLCTGYAPHNVSIAWIHRADALFLPLHDLPPGRRSLIVPGKIYEYLAANRPIIACVPEGDARDLISEIGPGVCAPPCEPDHIAKMLVAISETTTQSVSNQCREGLIRFERCQLTKQLAQFLNSTVEDPQCGNQREPSTKTAHFSTPLREQSNCEQS